MLEVKYITISNVCHGEYCMKEGTILYVYIVLYIRGHA